MKTKTDADYWDDEAMRLFQSEELGKCETALKRTLEICSTPKRWHTLVFFYCRQGRLDDARKAYPQQAKRPAGQESGFYLGASKAALGNAGAKEFDTPGLRAIRRVWRAVPRVSGAKKRKP